MGAQELIYVSPQKYLDTERLALDKHEYFEGEVFAMSGASIVHNVLFKNTYIDLGIKLKGKKCQPYGSDLRIHIPKNSLYTYPDISIICDEIETTDDKFDTITNPSVLFEILSPSTQKYDRIEKFDLYREIDSLKEYIMINSEKILVLQYIRNPDNSWLMMEYKSLDTSFTIQTVAVELKLSDIYFDINFSDTKK